MIDTAKLIDRSVAILFQPAYYFGSDADAMDFNEGATYAAIMGLLGGLIGVVLSGALFSKGAATALIAAIILGPVIAVIAAVIAAAIIFGLCRFLDSRKDFGDAFGIATAAAALYPVNAVLGLIPGIGGLVGLLWSWWIVTEGVVAIHGIDRGSARITFGAVYVLLALIGAIA